MDDMEARAEKAEAQVEEGSPWSQSKGVRGERSASIETARAIRAVFGASWSKVGLLMRFTRAHGPRPLRANGHRGGVMADEKRCAQCGRIGVRAFKTIPELIHKPTGARIGPITVCLNETACRRRWPKTEED